MSLIQEINRTETNKNKTKTVATQIDNKLTELGGEQAINLNEVAEKIKLLASNFNKICILEINKNFKSPVPYQDNINFDFNINLEKINLNLKKVILYLNQNHTDGTTTRDDYAFFVDTTKINEMNLVVVTDSFTKVTLTVKKFENNILTLNMNGKARKIIDVMVKKAICLG